jgi:hypothetical protein
LHSAFAAESSRIRRSGQTRLRKIGIEYRRPAAEKMRAQQKLPRLGGGFRVSDCEGRLSGEGQVVLPLSICHEADAAEAKDQCPCGGFGDSL